jgi:hypothetical protein
MSIFEGGLPRKIFTDEKEFLKFVNQNNGIKNAIYRSLYNFKDTMLKNGKEIPNYETAIIDKVMFDFDDRECDNKAWEECNKLHQELCKEKIRHKINMSGRGYHLFILTEERDLKYPKSSIYNCQKFYIDKLKLLCDDKIVGNIAQMCRVANTYNAKAKRFCVPLTQDVFEKGDEYSKNFGLMQRLRTYTSFMGGDKLLNLKQFDNETKQDCGIIIENLEQSSSDNIVLKDIPIFIKELLEKKTSNYKERYLIILYFKESGNTKKEIYEILKQYLTPKKFHHCISEERQLQYLFDRDDLVFPSLDTIQKMGIKVNNADYRKIYKLW